MHCYFSAAPKIWPFITLSQDVIHTLVCISHNFTIWLQWLWLVSSCIRLNVSSAAQENSATGSADNNCLVNPFAELLCRLLKCVADSALVKAKSLPCWVTFATSGGAYAKIIHLKDQPYVLMLIAWWSWWFTKCCKTSAWIAVVTWGEFIGAQIATPSNL